MSVQEISFQLFKRQYFQQLDALSFPSAELLKRPDVQAYIYRSMFNADQRPYLPPSRYQKWVLKIILEKIENAIEDPEEDVCFSDLTFA